MKQVLVVGEGIEFRTFARTCLEQCADVEVKGIAADKKIAFQKLLLSPYDLIVVGFTDENIELIDFICELKKSNLNLPLIILSFETWLYIENLIADLKYYPIGYVCQKVSGSNEFERKNAESKIAKALESKINQITSTLPPAKKKSKDEFILLPPVSLPLTDHSARQNLDLFKPNIIVIGSSTGGPEALEKIFSQIKLPLSCPIVIVQHMPKNFTRTLAESLERLSHIPAKEAEHGEIVKPGIIYVAPGDFHLTIVNNGKLNVFNLLGGALINSVRPAVDPLFASAATAYGKNCMAYVLTGMGEDGAVGATAVKNAGGAVTIQSPETCVVFGMPGAVRQLGAFDAVLSPGEIGVLINQQTK